MCSDTENATRSWEEAGRTLPRHLQMEPALGTLTGPPHGHRIVLSVALCSAAPGNTGTHR